MHVRSCVITWRSGGQHGGVSLAAAWFVTAAAGAARWSALRIVYVVVLFISRRSLVGPGGGPVVNLPPIGRPILVCYTLHTTETFTETLTEPAASSTYLWTYIQFNRTYQSSFIGFTLLTTYFLITWLMALAKYSTLLSLIPEMENLPSSVAYTENSFLNLITCSELNPV